MSKKCLYCYKELEAEGDFHPSCSASFFESPHPPVLNYTMAEMAELAKKVVENSITVPGVQPKLSLGIINDFLQGEGSGRLTVIGALGGELHP